MVEESSDAKVLATRHGAVATGPLNRPDRANGLTAELKERFAEAPAAATEPPSHRATEPA